MKKRVVGITALVSCLIFAFSIAFGEQTYSLRSGSETATITNIRVSGSKLYISAKYTNSGSKAESFGWTFGYTVWQDGRECDRDTFNRDDVNSMENIKDGATISVTEVYSLRNTTSLVEIDFHELFSWVDNKVSIYCNPQSGKWGSKNEVSATPTPKPTATPELTPEPTPEPTPAPKEAVFTEDNQVEVWYCPSCGKELSSRFCPDCGTTSPTPHPTATPTPEPTAVPMDASKPVENVVKYPYTVYENGHGTAGIFTGEIVDGFPHGYGVFECKRWIYVGGWAYGVRDGEGRIFYLYPGAVSRDEYYSVGNYVTFGTYPQTKAGDDATPIEWLVLARDGQKALLISRYGLDAQKYNAMRADTTWETCTLRTWLNGEFIKRAFTDEEQAGILQTEVDNSQSQGYSEWKTIGGNNTSDRVFLLSYAEANKYLGVTKDDKKNMKSRISPTEYAVQQGAYTSSFSKTADEDVSGWWWLRSPGFHQDYAAFVSSDGSLFNFHSVSNTSGCIRPALWIDLESGIF